MNDLNESLERKILGRINAIKRGEVTPKDSGIGAFFKHLTDEVMKGQLMERYKMVLSGLTAGI